MTPALALLLAVVMVLLLGLALIPAAAIGFFAWSRERCRRDSWDGEEQPQQQPGERAASGKDTHAAAAALPPPPPSGAGELDGAGDDGSGEGVDARRRTEDLVMGLLGGKTGEQATADDIKGLSKREFMRLFRLLPPATPAQLHGEWTVDVLAMGLNWPIAHTILHWHFGRGWYLGKGFDQEAMGGYCTFYNHGEVTRSRRFDMFMGPSSYDEERSLHLRYGRYNSGIFGGVHDEIRCLNGELFMGLGSLNPRIRTSFNSIPFLVVGPRQPVRDWDRERQ